MKFQQAALTLLCAAPFAAVSVEAFSIPGLQKVKRSTASSQCVVASPETETKSSTNSKDRPIYDPLGLYPDASEEKQSGRIRALEPKLEVTKPVTDPMGLYPKDSPEFQASLEEAQESANVEKPIFDPIGLYPDSSEERQQGKIQPMEPKFQVDKSVEDPMGLYPTNTDEFMKSLELEKESLANLNRDLYDPLGLYPEDSVERQEGRIQEAEPEVDVTKPVSDPLNLYPSELKKESTDRAVIRSEALPFVARPAVLDGELAGDYGFDPLGFAKSKDDLYFLRDAELKHSRIAMLAAAGWPLAELLDKKFAGLLHMKPLLVEGDRVPSILNGGLSQINPFYWMGILAIAGFFETLEIMKQKDNVVAAASSDRFDPLNLFPQSEEGQRRMEVAEIKHGRLAMLAITAFAAFEAVTKTAIVDATPLFFHPPF